MTLAQAIEEAKVLSEQRRCSGFDQDALDAAAKSGLAHGAFEESAEEGGDVVDEFFPTAASNQNPPPQTLAGKLQAKAGRHRASRSSVAARAAASSEGGDA
jgi:hypothetical protein